MVSFLVTMKSSADELVEIGNVFKKMDLDNNGFLTVEEIEKSIESMIGSSQTDFESILRAADSNNDG